MSKNVIERTAAYLQQLMTAEERVEFETKLVEDRNLAAALEWHQSIENAMQTQEKNLHNEKALRHTLTCLGQLYFNPLHLRDKPAMGDSLPGIGF